MKHNSRFYGDLQDKTMTMDDLLYKFYGPSRLYKSLRDNEIK